MLNTILFDVDGVLVNSFEANLKFYQDLFRNTKYSAPTREEYANLFHKSVFEVIKTITKGDQNEIDTFYKIGMGPGVDYDTSLISIPENTQETLEILSKKYNIGIVTSRAKESVFEGPYNNLEHIRKYFKVIVALEDTVNHKPHPEPLLFAAKKFGVDQSKCVYIGDTESDMLASKEAGMKFIHYSNNPSLEADAGTYSFMKIPELIENLS